MELLQIVWLTVATFQNADFSGGQHPKQWQTGTPAVFQLLPDAYLQPHRDQRKTYTKATAGTESTTASLQDGFEKES